MRNLSYENEFRLQVHFHANQTHFHENGFALTLALKQRHKGTRKWPCKIRDMKNCSASNFTSCIAPRCHLCRSRHHKAVNNHRFNQSDLHTRSWYHATAASIECLQTPMCPSLSPGRSRLARLRPRSASSH